MKSMIKNLIKLAIVLIIGILIYNYFLGTEAEKETSRKIFKEVKDVAVGVKDLVKSEKEKFDAGKYDDAVDKVGALLGRLKQSAKDFDEKYLDRIDELEKKRKELSDALSEYENEQPKLDSETSDELVRKEGGDTAKIKRELEELMKETESLIQEMESGN